MHAIKVHTVTSDGAIVTAPTRRVPIAHPRTGQILPDVWVEVFAQPLAVWRDIQKAHEVARRHPVTKVVEWVTDDDAARDALLVKAVRAWHGFVGSDDLPLCVCPAAVGALDYSLKTQLAIAILENEVVTLDETFPQPA